MAVTINNPLVEQVNELLLAEEPENVSIDTYSHYSGYKPQYIIDAMNTVYGIGSWGFEELSTEVITVPSKDGESSLVISHVKVWLKDIAFQPTGWGQARVTKGDMGDARKGAQTDALKKALSYFSIGNRAYQGLLPDKPVTNNSNQRTAQPTRPNTSQTTKPVTQPATNGATKSVPINKTPETRKDQIADDLASVPSGKALFELAEGLGLNRSEALSGAFKSGIEKGAIKLSQLLGVGDELPPKYCKILAAWLDTYAESPMALAS